MASTSSPLVVLGESSATRSSFRAMRQGIAILVATPGRLLDLCSQGLVNLRAIETFVLDEADRMLDMGFLPDIRRIIDKLPDSRQTLFFSATIPADIRRLSDTILRNPVRVAATPVSSPAEAVEHSVYFVERHGKGELLRHLLSDDSIKNALVFTRTKHGADRVARQLSRAHVSVEAIHGDKSQIPICPTSRRPTSTASAAPGGPARPASPCPFAASRSGLSSSTSKG